MKKWKLYGTFLMITTCLSACFNTRKPDLPNSTTSWISPNEPMILLSNFQKATAELNLNNYQRCFSPSLQFIADRNATGNNTGVFQSWTIIEELEYIKNLNKKTIQTSANSLKFSGGITNFLTADSLEYTADYELELFHQDSTFNRFNFKGKAILALRRNSSNEWAISRWQDNRRSNAEPCWTDVKLHFIAP